MKRSKSFREEIERIADDYVPENSNEYGIALDEMRDALKSALADTTLNKDPNAEEVARILSHFVNCMGNKVEDVVRAFDNEHRTLQQGITKFAVKWLEECANKHTKHDYDLRNQASCELGKAFVERITTQERALPFI